MCFGIFEDIAPQVTLHVCLCCVTSAQFLILRISLSDKSERYMAGFQVLFESRVSFVVSSDFLHQRRKKLNLQTA